MEAKASSSEISPLARRQVNKAIWQKYVRVTC